MTRGGLQTYLNDGGKDFGIVCGDTVISSYQEGAMLVYGLSMKFDSLHDKKLFLAEVDHEIFNIKSAFEYFSKIVTDTKAHGQVTVHAYQVGGDPVLTNLAKILPNSER